MRERENHAGLLNERSFLDGSGCESRKPGASVRTVRKLQAIRQDWVKKMTASDVILEPLERHFSVCKVKDYSGIDLGQPFVFSGCTDQERSIVCPTDLVPENTVAREDGWRAFRVCGELDFSLIGILSGITRILADRQIGVFVISTYNTDYVMTKETDFEKAMDSLREAGYISVGVPPASLDGG